MHLYSEVIFERCCEYEFTHQRRQNFFLRFIWVKFGYILLTVGKLTLCTVRYFAKKF